MTLIDAFVRNPIKVAVGVLLLLLFGGIAITRLPMQLTPEVQTPTIQVETRWPGASPQEVEREIIQPQEEQLKAVEGLTKLSSESMDSQGRVTLEFLVGTNMNEALLKVNTRLQQVREYPIEADEPVLSTSNSSDRPIGWFILSPRVPTPDEIAAVMKAHPDLADALRPVRDAQNSGLRFARLKELVAEHPERKELAELLPPERDMTTFRRFAEDTIEARFERVPGVSNSNVIGGREDELQVILDPRKLAARGLTMNDVRRALQGRNQDTSAGDFWEGKRRYVVRTLGQLRTPEEVREVLLASTPRGSVTVRDVGIVRKGYKKPTGVVRHFGETSIAINCQRETGANVLDVMAGLRRATRELNEQTLGPRGLQLEQVYDETDYIYSAVGLVNQNIIIGGILTVIVLLLFLRSGRSTLVIGLAIPTSLIGTFLILDLVGRSLNVISLAGLAFAVGMLVDNAVVVLENIYRHYEMGKGSVRAAVKGTQEVWGAVVASTLTTLAVFLPVLFVEEEAGQLFRDIAISVSSAVFLSLLLSVTLISTMTARILPRRDEDENRPESDEESKLLFIRWLDRVGEGFIDGVVGLNGWLQRGLVRRLGTVVGFVLVAVLLSWALFPKVEYLPTGNRNLVFGIILPPPGYNLDQLLDMGTTIEEDLRPYWDVEPGSEAAEKLDHPIIGDFFYVARGRQVFLGLRAEHPLEAAGLIPLIQRVAGKLPGTFAVAKQSSLFEQGLSAGRTIDVEITGPELEQLIQYGRRVMGQVREVVPGAQAFPRPSLDLSSPELHVRPKWNKMADVGLTATELGYAVNALVDGAFATDYFVGGDKIDLTIMGQSTLTDRTQDVEAVSIATPTGDLVPLSAVARVRLGSGPEQINHRERERSITIQVSPPPTTALEEAMDGIQSKIVGPMVKQGLPDGYRVTLSGTADKLRATWQALRFNILLALLITYLLMSALFESWLYPFVIMLSVPLGAVGGFAGLWLLNRFIVQPLDVLTMLGFVILIGTVVNNAILIVHQSLNHIREDEMMAREAILESVRSRIRPIFMTTTTTVFGLLPLVVYPGAGSELYRGLGSVVLGGLVVSTVFTLFLVPTLFSLVMDAKERLVGAEATFESQEEPEQEEEPESEEEQTVG